MALNKIKCENRIRVPHLKKYLSFSVVSLQHTKMDENVILTKLVKMELCDPAFRPHVKKTTTKQTQCDS